MELSPCMAEWQAHTSALEEYNKADAALQGLRARQEEASHMEAWTAVWGECEVARNALDEAFKALRKCVAEVEARGT